MSDIDRSKAPDGATHYNPMAGSDVKWYRRGADGWFFWLSKSLVWDKSGNDPDFFAQLIELPSLAWTGEGLPPVGTVCEFMCTARGKEREWQPALVKYASPFTVVLDDYSATAGELEGEFVAHPDTMLFRPIRTPEQIAAEEREKAIEELRQLLSGVPCDDYHAAVAVIEAGYRKAEAP